LIALAVVNCPQSLRRREFTVENSTWAVSPFMAFLALPRDRLFV
jgi:hypothetical protein